MADILQQLGVDWRLLIAQLANFAILFYVLKRFAYKPVLDALDARQKRIERANEDARKAEEQAEASEEEKKKMLDEARARSTEIITEAEKDAEARKERILEEAEKEKKKIEEEGRQTVRAERDTLRRELKTEMGELVAEAVRKTVADFADEKTSKQLTEEAISIINSHHSTAA